MERMWPKGDVLPLFQFYMAQNIEDMISSRGDIVVYTLQSFLDEHKVTQRLDFMIHSNNLLNRVMFVAGSLDIPHVPDILVDKNKEPSLYRLTNVYVFLPRVQHVKEEDNKVRGGVVLFDHSGEVRVFFPSGRELAVAERFGWLNRAALQENDWQSGVILRCSYKTARDKYTLVQVFNKWAMENQESVLQQFINRLAPKFTG